jgi:hypothetical protein
MPIEEQQKLREKYYAEAVRYMDNARDALRKAGKRDDKYTDSKYVSTACGIAYKAVLIALDAYLFLHNVEANKKRKSIEYYHKELARLDKKLLKETVDAYTLLHIRGYYDGVLDVYTIHTGFDHAQYIIDKIKPSVQC